MNKDNTLIEYELKRVHNGVLLKLRSKPFNSFFKAFGVHSHYDNNWSGNMPYRSSFVNNNSLFNSIVGSWRKNLMLDPHIPNLSFIRCENLDQWQKFLLIHPISNAEIKNFDKYFSALCLDFYNEVVIPLEIRNLVRINPNLKKIKNGLSRIEVKQTQTFDIGIDQISDDDFNRIFAELSGSLT